MKEISKALEYKGKKYNLVFNLNVMEVIQDKYGTLENWGKLTDGAENDGEPNAKAVIFGITAMLNEGIDIENEENGTEEKMLTNKQVGRMITEIGLQSSAQLMNGVVVDSTQSAEKNA
nr:MAG TPA: tail tube protein [Caudoviricetes sp.]